MGQTEKDVQYWLDAESEREHIRTCWHHALNWYKLFLEKTGCPPETVEKLLERANEQFDPQLFGRQKEKAELFIDATCHAISGLFRISVEEAQSLLTTDWPCILFGEYTPPDSVGKAVVLHGQLSKGLKVLPPLLHPLLTEHLRTDDANKRLQTAGRLDWKAALIFYKSWQD
jgi:hypothetical protein